MLNFKHGVLLGTLIYLAVCQDRLFCHNNANSFHTVQITDNNSYTNPLSFSYQAHESTEISHKPRLTSFELAYAYITDDAFCQWRYHLSATEIQKLLHLKYTAIIEALLNLNHLSEHEIIELWNIYKQKCWQKKRIQQCQKYLIDALNKQRAQKVHISHNQTLQQQEMYHKFLQSEHESLELNCDFDESILHHALRHEALNESKWSNYQQYEQTYELNAQTRGYLLAKNITPADYQYCYGTALQQQLHSEMCSLLEQSAALALQNQHSPFATHTVHFVEASHTSNEKSWLNVTATLLDIGQGCINIAQDIAKQPQAYLQAIASGIYESGSDFIKALTHPIDTIQNIGQMIYFVLETAAINEAASQYPYPATHDLFIQRQQYIDTALSNMQQHFAQMSGPERAQALTKFGADFIIPAKITHACSQLLSKTHQLNSNQAWKQFTSILTENTDIAKNLKNSSEKFHTLELATEHGMIEQITTQFMEAEKTLASTPLIAPRPLKVLIDEIKSFPGGIIPKQNKKLINEVKKAFKETENQLKSTKLPLLRKQFQSKVIDNKQVHVALDHIYNFELKLKHSNKSQGFIMQITGGHMPGVCEALEQTGLIKIIKKDHLPSGATNYYLQNTTTGKILNEPKTTFPSAWNEEKIAQAIWNVYQQSTATNVQLDQFPGYMRNGIFENFEMSLLIKKSDPIYIKTALPYKYMKTGN